MAAGRERGHRTTAVVPAQTWRRGTVVWDVTVDMVARMSVEDVAAAAAVRPWGGGREIGRHLDEASGRPQWTPSPWTQPNSTGCWYVVADETIEGGESEPCHYERGHLAAVGDVASVEVAAQRP